MVADPIGETCDVIIGRAAFDRPKQISKGNFPLTSHNKVNLAWTRFGVRFSSQRGIIAPNHYLDVWLYNSINITYFVIGQQLVSKLWL